MCDGRKTEPMGKLWGRGPNSDLDIRKLFFFQLLIL